MKRFSIGFTDNEYGKLEEMMRWYESRTGVRLSRCAMIKHLLFGAQEEIGLFLASDSEKSFKRASNGGP